MRVLALTRSLPSHVGGGGMELVADDLLNSWCMSGHEVICGTTPYSSGSNYNPGFEVLQLSGSSGVYSRAWFQDTLTVAKSVKPDIVFGVSAGAHTVALRGNFPCVMQAHGTALRELQWAVSIESRFRRIGRLPELLSGLLRDVITYRKYRAVVAVGSPVLRDLELFPHILMPSRLVLIENGVPEASFESAGSQVEPTSLGLEGLPRPLIFFCGRLHRQKGLDLLLNSLGRMSGGLVVAGIGPMEREMRDVAARIGVAHRIRFLGKLDRGTIYRVMRTADVVVIPSRGAREGLSLVMLEALMNGCRVVASRQVASGLGGLNVEGLTVIEPEIGSLIEGVSVALRGGHSRLPLRFTAKESAAAYIRLFEECV